MSQFRSSGPRRFTFLGDTTVASLLISVLILLAAYIAIRPRFSEGRLLINKINVLTSEEVSLLPDGTLPVVLGRGLAEGNRSFRLQLLRLVMQRSGVPHAVGFTSSALTQDAAVDALSTGALGGSSNTESITVGAYGAGPTLNRQLRAIPIPISGGLLGLRVGWAHRSRLKGLEGIQNIEDLRSFTLLQGQGWSELGIFDNSGLRTFATPSHNLFRLVSEERVDLFPQGIESVEAQEITAKKWSKSIVIEPSLLISYPFARFFYVNKDNKKLAEAIERGFELAIADGSYQVLLERVVMTPWLKQRLALRQRTVIFLPNPAAQQAFERVKPSHWLVPWDDLAAGRIKTGEQLCALSRFQALCK